MSKIIGVTVGTPLSVGKIEEKLKPVKKEYVDSTFATKETAAGLESRIKIHDKRITNIEKGTVPEAFETDSSVAYVKDVPADACPYAAVNTLGGMTRKCTNLANITLQYGLWVFDENRITSSENYVCTSSKIAIKPNTTYSLSGNAISNLSGNLGFFGADGAYLGSQVYVFDTFTTPENAHYFAFHIDKSYASNISGTIMLNSGDTALPYEPFFEGLRSAPTTEVESVGVNLLPESRVPSVFTEFATVEVDDILANHIGERITLSFDVKLDELVAEEWILAIYTYQSNGVGIANSFTIKPSTQWQRVSFETSVKDYGIVNPDYSVGRIALYDSYYNTYSIKNMQIVLGDNDLPYRPYTRNTLPIPEAVRPAHGINENVYDYIEWCEDGTRKSYKRVKKVVLDGSENWARYSDSDSIRGVGYCYALRITNKKVKGMSNCSHFNRVTMAWDFGKIGDYCDGNSDLNVYFVTSETTVEEWKSRLAANPITLVYELATPEVTDISDILPADNYIGVEGGGTLTFKNQFEFDVPSEVTYQIKEATV